MLSAVVVYGHRQRSGAGCFRCCARDLGRSFDGNGPLAFGTEELQRVYEQWDAGVR